MKHIDLHSAGFVAAFDCHAGTELYCQHGLLWVTEGNGDLLLRGGERIRLSGAQRVVIQALEPSHFRLTSPVGIWLGTGLALLQALQRRLRRWAARRHDVRLGGQQT